MHFDGFFLHHLLVTSDVSDIEMRLLRQPQQQLEMSHTVSNPELDFTQVIKGARK